MDETLTAAPAVEDPDAELVRLEAELMASIGPTEAAGRAHAAVEEAMFAWKAANPMPTGRAAVEEWEKAKDAAKRACRYGEVEAAFLALIQKQHALLDEMADTRATTLRGLQIKARLATHPDEGFHGDLAWSIAADVLEMGCAEDDPIFAAIERHRTALIAYDDFLHKSEQAWDRSNGAPGWTDELGRNSHDELAARFEAHRRALADLLDRKPTTADGCAAALHYVHKLVTEQGGEINSEPAKHYFKYWNPPASFLANVATALEGRSTA